VTKLCVRLYLVFLWSSLLVGCGTVHSTIKSPTAETPDSLFLDSLEFLKEDPYFEQVIERQNQNMPSMEKAKIEYLIERLRHSPHTFVRNGESHTGGVAARLVEWKYGRRKKQIGTARDFINKVASRSEASGRPYLVLIANGAAYLARDVLSNELKLLERFIAAR
jgi:hypothetical protein